MVVVVLQQRPQVTSAKVVLVLTSVYELLAIAGGLVEVEPLDVGSTNSSLTFEKANVGVVTSRVVSDEVLGDFKTKY